MRSDMKRGKHKYLFIACNYFFIDSLTTSFHSLTFHDPNSRALCVTGNVKFKFSPETLILLAKVSFPLRDEGIVIYLLDFTCSFPVVRLCKAELHRSRKHSLSPHLTAQQGAGLSHGRATVFLYASFGVISPEFHQSELLTASGTKSESLFPTALLLMVVLCSVEAESYYSPVCDK